MPQTSPNARSVGFRGEIAETFALSWPIVLSNLALNLMQMTDVIFVGRLSADALASAALGYNLFLPLYLLVVGLVAAAAPIAAAIVGADAGDVAGVRRASDQALLSALLLSAPLLVVLWNAESLLLALGEPPNLAHGAGVYLHGFAWAAVPGFFHQIARSVFSALGRTREALLAGLIAVAFNAAANYVLVFGALGIPALGLFGSGLATTLANALMFLIMIAFAGFDPRLRPYRFFSRVWRPDQAAMRKLWALGAPIGLTIAAEVGTFAAAGLAMGLIGAAALAAHSIALQIASMAFMVPLGLGQAATVRVGHAYGAGDPGRASRAGWAVFGLTVAFAAVSGTVMAVFPGTLISAFIDPHVPGADEVTRLAISFVGVAALFQLFDGAQAALSNMLRGVHDSRTPMLLALAGYWLVGAPVGLTLAFATSLRGLGLWLGLLVGLVAVSTLLLWRWRAREKAGFGLPLGRGGLRDVPPAPV